MSLRSRRRAKRFPRDIPQGRATARKALLQRTQRIRKGPQRRVEGWSELSSLRNLGVLCVTSPKVLVFLAKFQAANKAKSVMRNLRAVHITSLPFLVTR